MVAASPIRRGQVVADKQAGDLEIVVIRLAATFLAAESYPALSNI
jgi:hypothetical protein